MPKETIRKEDQVGTGGGAEKKSILERFRDSRELRGAAVGAALLGATAGEAISKEGESNQKLSVEEKVTETHERQYLSGKLEDFIEANESRIVALRILSSDLEIFYDALTDKVDENSFGGRGNRNKVCKDFEEANTISREFIQEMDETTRSLYVRARNGDKTFMNNFSVSVVIERALEELGRKHNEGGAESHPYSRNFEYEKHGRKGQEEKIIMNILEQIRQQEGLEDLGGIDRDTINILKVQLNRHINAVGEKLVEQKVMLEIFKIQLDHQ